MDDVIDKIMSGHPGDGQRAMMSKFNLNKDKLRKIAMDLVQSGKRSKWLTAKDGSKLEVYIRSDGMVCMGYEPNDEQDKANKDLAKFSLIYNNSTCIS